MGWLPSPRDMPLFTPQRTPAALNPLAAHTPPGT